MSQPDSNVATNARNAVLLCSGAAIAGGLYMVCSRWLGMFALDLVGGGHVGDFIDGIVHAPIAASIPYIVARQPRLLHLMPWLEGRGRHILAAILFVLGWAGPFGPLTVLAASSVAVGYYWASLVPYEEGLAYRFVLAFAGLSGFGLALLLLFLIGIAPISALMIFPIHLGLWLGLRRLKFLAFAERAASRQAALAPQVAG